MTAVETHTYHLHHHHRYHRLVRAAQLAGRAGQANTYVVSCLLLRHPQLALAPPQQRTAHNHDHRWAYAMLYLYHQLQVTM